MCPAWEVFRPFTVFPGDFLIRKCPDIYLQCSQSVPKIFPKKIHYGHIFQDILNIPLWNISVALFLCILNFTGWVNYGYFTRDIVKNTLDDPPRNTVGTFFGNIFEFSHTFPNQEITWEHCEWPEHFPSWAHFS
jgi:hypothetical protein